MFRSNCLRGFKNLVYIHGLVEYISKDFQVFYSFYNLVPNQHKSRGFTGFPSRNFHSNLSYYLCSTIDIPFSYLINEYLKGYQSTTSKQFSRLYNLIINIVLQFFLLLQFFLDSRTRTIPKKK